MDENERDELADEKSGSTCPITGRTRRADEYWARFLDPGTGEYHSVAPEAIETADGRGWRRFVSESDPEYVQRQVRRMGEQLQAAGELIESLEEEVAALRIELEQNRAAVLAAQEEVRAREAALQERDEGRDEAVEARLVEAEERHRREVEGLREELEEARARQPSEEAESEEPESRLAELQEELAARETERDELRQQLEDERRWSEESRQQLQSELLEQHEEQLGHTERRLEEMGTARDRAVGQAEELEQEAAEAQRENRYLAAELSEARRQLEEAADPERRLRAGVALFNESQHARVVAATSNSFGLPRVHVRLDESAPGKARLTFIWGILGWRRYLADPTEEIEEPRVYLEGSGDEAEELPAEEASPNARIDDRGRVSLGVQAR